MGYNNDGGDDDDNEVNGNGATSNNDCYISYYNIVNLIIYC
jgi:hypothetical protein